MTRARWIAAISLVVSVAPLAAQTPPTAEALRALDYGDDAGARAVLAPAAAEAALWLAVAERGEARRSAAASAAALAPESLAWVRAAARGLAAQDTAAAIAGLREATSLAPGEARLWKVLGDLLRGADDDAGARAAYERAAALRPELPSANLALGQLAQEQGDFATAHNAFNHALDERGEPVAALLGRAGARLYLGDSAGALADLEAGARKAAAGFERYRALMGIVYVRTYLRQLPQGLDRADEAARMWEQLGRADMVAATCNATGRVLLETGAANDAQTWYERGWRAIESSTLPAEQRTIWQVRALHGYARVAAQRRDLERARQLADEAAGLMAADSANAEHYAWIGPYLTGYVRLAERRYDEAVAELQKSDLERPYLRYLLAEAYARARNREAAREWYEKALAAATGLDSEAVIVRPLASAWLAKNR